MSDDVIDDNPTEDVGDEIEVVHEEDVPDTSDETVQEYQVYDDKVEPIEAEAEEEPEEDEEPIEKKPKKHKPLKAEFNRVQKEKYQALHEIELLKLENDRLQKLAALTAESATYHNDKSIELKLAQARSAKTAAYESADTEGMLKADELFAEAMNAKAESDRWKSQQRYNQEQHAQRVQQQQYLDQQREQAPQEYLNEDSENWISQNPWYDPESNDYNEDIAQDVMEYSKLIDRKYARMGQEDRILTQQYFDEIDKYVSEHHSFTDEEEYEEPARRAQKAPVRQQQARTNINMKPVRNNIAPVGKTVKSAANPNPNRVVLSAKERDFVKTMGITESEYAKQKLGINKSGRYGYENNKR